MANGIFFTRHFWPTVGGVEEHSHQMARHLTELGENITLLHYVPEGFQGDAEFDRTCGYPVVRFSTKIGTGGWYRDPWTRTVLFTTLLRQARQTGADYVIYNGTGGNSLADASLAAVPRILGIPAFLYVHDGDELLKWMGMRSRFQSFLSNSLLRSVAGVLTVSHWNVPFLLSLNLKPERIDVIHNGFDFRETDSYLRRRNTVKFDRLDAAFPTACPVILSLSRLVPHKRIDRLIEVMPRVLASVPTAQLVIAGAGIEEDSLRRMAAESSTSDSITVLGAVTPEEKYECYARCDVFALATDHEGFGLIFLEANAFGKPVVGTSVGGVLEAVEDGVSGLLVEPCDSQALADALIGLLRGPDRARRMGEKGRRRVEAKFTWRQSAEKLRGIVHQAIG